MKITYEYMDIPNICISCISVCLCSYFFRVFLEDKYGFPAHIANIVNSLVYLISAGVSPVFGIAVDKTGFNLIWCKSHDFNIQ